MISRTIKEQNIGWVSFLGFSIILVLFTVVVGVTFLSDTYKHFQSDAREATETYTTLLKERLISEVNMQTRRLSARRRLASEHLKSLLESRVNEAHSIATHLYNKNRKQKSPSEIADLIKESLRPINFNDDNGYLFILTSKGQFILDPLAPSQAGVSVNIFESLFSARTEPFQKMVAIVESVGEGFVSYQWPMPNSDHTNTFEKISYVKHFEPFDWIIGTGEYVENQEETQQKAIAQQLNNIVLDTANTDYIFIYELHNMQGGANFATMLVNPNRIDIVGTQISDTETDIKGHMYRKEMLQGIREKGESFVTYWYTKPGSEEPVSKLSYFKYYPEWNWIVAKGVYLDRLDERVAQIHSELAQKVRKTILYLVLFVLGSCAVFMWLSYRLSQGLQGIFETYKTTQEKQKATIEQNEKRLKEAQHVAQLGYWEFDLRDNTLVWSDETHRIFQIDPTEAQVSLDVFKDAIHPDDRDFVLKAYKESVGNKSLYDIEHRILMQDGAEKWVREKCTTEYDTEGQAVRSLGIVQDITEIKALRGILPICANCHKIRDDKGYWQQVDQYLAEHSSASLSHSLCKTCLDDLYGGESWYEKTSKGDDLPPVIGPPSS